MKVSTVKLQDMVARAVKGAGFNKFLPITSMIGIRVRNGYITLSTQDGTNYLYIKEKIADEFSPDDNFDVTVDAETFSKLVSKLTCETVKLLPKNNTLVVEGNGSYKLALPLDDSGEPVEYPNLIEGIDKTEFGRLSTSVISLMVDTLKPVLATNVASLCYNNYLMSDYIVATDRTMLNAYKNSNKFEQDMLFSREFVDLLNLATDEVVLSKTDDGIVAESGTLTIFSKAPTSTDEFNKTGVQKMIDLEYDSYCKLRKSDLLPLLERIALFVGAYDSGTIHLNFTENGLEVKSVNDSGIELIEYMESKDYKPTSIKIDVNKLLTQLKAYKSDSIDLYYGNFMCIKLVDGDVIQIVALIS